jgi:Rps23 Pro-64 3,4-dihydroxylase Tpa1-like proline 4-hydroxylase
MHAQPTPSLEREALADLILLRMRAMEPALKAAFEGSKSAVGVRYCVVDDLLPAETAAALSARFPQAQSMRLMNTFRERKHTSKALDRFDPSMAAITFAVQDRRVVDLVERITGIPEQIPDSTLYAGGLSVMTRGHFLAPHIDNSHEASRRHYRTLNLLYYLSPDWGLECGGNLELWDAAVKQHVTIESRFNRLVIMETTPTSWHSVSPVRAEQPRLCVSNYYFSPRSPTGQGYFHVTSFSAWPDQPFKRAWAAADNVLRRGLRVLRPGGFGRRDIYAERGP